MKLGRRRRFESFYESFSDLIFGTMAIFVLLMIIFLTMVNEVKEQSVSKETYEQLQAASKTRIEQAQASAEEARQQAEALAAANKELEQAVRFSELQMAIVVDVSGSMEKALQSLRETVRTLSRVLSKMSPDFRIAVIAHRQKVLSGEKFIELPLVQVQPAKSGESDSQRKVNDFLAALEPLSGMAKTADALERAREVLGTPEKPSTIQLILLLGDMGPYEVIGPNGQWAYFDEPTRRQIDETEYRRMADWVSGRPQRRVASVFSGVLPNGAGPDAMPLSNESRLFFETLVSRAGQPMNFSPNEGEMLALIIDAILKKD